MRSRASVLKLGMAVTLSLGVADLGLINLVLAPRLEQESRRSRQVTASAAQPGGEARPDPGPGPGPSKPNKVTARAGPARAPDVAPPSTTQRAVPTTSAAPSATEPSSAPPPAPAAPKAAPPVRAEPPAAPPSILFATNQSGLDERGRQAARRVAAVMKRRVELKVECRGHTDQRGQPDQNLRLSRLRAEAVTSALVELGVTPARIDTKWFGSSRPVANEQTSQAWARNRRVELRWR